MKQLLRIFFLFPLVIFAQQNAYWQQQIKYQMEVDVDTKNDTYTGKQTIHYINNSPTQLTKVYFHLYWNAFQPNSRMSMRLNELKDKADTRMIVKKDGVWVSKIDELQEKDWGKQEILSIVQNGKKLDYTINGTILEVKLAQPITANGGELSLKMEWNTQIPSIIRRSGKNNAEGVRLSMAQWYPKMVEYDYDGWHTDEYLGREFHGVFGSFDVSISIDSNYIVGAGGQLLNPKEVNGYGYSTKEKKQTYHFTANNIHDFAWAADPDFIVEENTVKTGTQIYYVYKKDKNPDYWQEVKPLVDKYFSFMKNHFGAYQYPTYSIIQGGDGGMEYGACTLVTGKHKTLEGFASLLFHEASHSWFQHMLATDENTSPFLDEGMATYAEELAFDQIFNKNQINPFINEYQGYVYLNKSGDEEPMTTLSDDYKSRNSYNNSAYTKSCVFYAQLGYIIGKDKLENVFKEYFEQWKLKHPRLRDFKHISQELSEMNLRNYFTYFITTTQTIDYAITDVASTSSKQTSITLQRIGEISMPIDLYITTSEGTTVYYIPETDVRGQKSQEYKQFGWKVEKDWNKQNSSYKLMLDIPKESILRIEIDATHRLADINYSNNLYVP